MTRRKLLGATLYAAVFAGALGFGATQAVASPDAAVVRACDPVRCNRDCIRVPGQSAGSCVNGQCVCSGGGNPPR